MQRPRFRRQFGWLPILLILITGLAIAVGVTALHYIEAMLVASAGNLLALAAEDLASQLDQIVFEASREMERLAQAPELQGLDRPAAARLLGLIQMDHPDYAWLALVDEQGGLLATTEPGAPRQDRRNEEWFLRVQHSAGPFIQDAAAFGDAGEAMPIGLAAPIRDKRAKFRGAVTLRLAWPELDARFALVIRNFERQWGASSNIEWVMLDRDGTILRDSQRGQDNRLNLKAAGLPSVLQSLAGQSGYVEEEHLRRHVRVITGYAKTGSGSSWGVLLRMDQQGIVRPIRIMLSKLTAAGAVLWIPLFGLVLWIVGRLRKEWRRATDSESRQEAQVLISTDLMEAGSWREVAPLILKTVCETMRWNLGITWRVDAEAGRLRMETLWRQPSLKADDFLTLSRATTFPPGQGLPGRVWQSGEPAWIPDVVTDRNFPRAPAAARNRLHGAFGVPIKSGGRVLGVIEFFSGDIKPPDQAVLTMMADIGLKIGAFIERKAAEAAAQANEQRFKLAIDSANDAIFYLDCDDVIGWTNRTAFSITDPSLDSLTGLPLMKALSSQPIARAQLTALIKRNSDERVPITSDQDVEILRPDGTTRWFDVSVTPVCDADTIVGRLLVARDHTDRRQMERDLRQSEKMASLGLLLDGVAHELNNPLFIIRGFAQVASEKIKAQQWGGLTEDVVAIAAGAQRAADTLQRATAVVRRTKGQREPCHLNPLVQQTLEVLAADLHNNKIELHCQYDRHLPVVLANAHELKQIILNLMTNAERAMLAANGKGVLTFATATIPTGGQSWAELRVSDTGPGIAPHLEHRIFELFATAQEGSKGTGLSLALCHRIVRDLGGTMLLENRPGSGATFILRLPAMGAVHNSDSVYGEASK